MSIGGTDRRALALRFVVGIGVVSLFADFTYEGARSINGPFLATLGVGAFWAGAIAGGGEFLGYLVRLFSGRWADRHGGHWRLMAVGLRPEHAVGAAARTRRWTCAGGGADLPRTARQGSAQPAARCAAGAGR
jgi:hypothetical protein